MPASAGEKRTPIGITGVSLVVRWDADKAVDWLEALRKRLDDPSPLLASFGGILRESFRENFAVGGRPGWKPLAPSTIKSKTRFLAKKPKPPFNKDGTAPKRLLQGGQFSGQTILVRTGKLRDSWVQKGATGHVEQAGKRTLFIGSQLTIERELAAAKPAMKYHILTKKAKAQKAAGKAVSARIPLARFHEEGTSKMPARKVAVLQPEDVAAMKRATVLWIEGKSLPGSGG